MKKLILLVLMLLCFAGCRANPKYNQNYDGTTRCRTPFDEVHQFADWVTGNEK